jgi:16S rRNA (cytosine967-C5)-methyltransferase
MKIDRPMLIRHLEDEGVAARPTSHSPDGIKVDGLKGGIVHLEAFKKGLCQVQSEAAQICSHLLCPDPGDLVLDLCAGVGGKSTHLAELMGGKGRVISLDIRHSRLLMLLESSQRLGIRCIQPVAADAESRFVPLLKEHFDKVLVDGPCSGLGIISRHPDVKWFRHEADIIRLTLVQKRILNHAAPLIKNGGTMLYVTCTISEEENEGVVNDFLIENGNMVLEDLKDHAPECALDLIDNHGFFKTLPHVHGMDGFFAALFRKVE